MNERDEARGASVDGVGVDIERVARGVNANGGTACNTNSANVDRTNVRGERVKLVDCCELLNGFAFKSKKYTPEGVRVIRITNVQKGYIEDSSPCFYPLEQVDLFKHCLLEENDLLVSLTGNVGRVALLEKSFLPAALNQRVACLRIKDESSLNKRYLFHALNSNFFENKCIESSNGIAQKNLSTRWLKEYSIFIPEIEKQLSIANRLDLIRTQIALAETQIEKLDLLVKSRFVEMFGDPKSNSKNLKTKSFIEVVKLQRGFDLPVKNRVLDGSIPVYGSNGLLGFHNKAKVDKAGIITGRSGTIGKVDVCDVPYWPLNTTLFSVDTHGNNIIYLRYLVEFFDLSRFKQGAGVPTLNRNIVHSEQIIDVPLSLQRDFAAFARKIEHLRETAQAQISTLRTLYDSLAQDYFAI